MLDIHSVRIFTTIVRLGGFSAAARAHATTQPSVSRRIRDLEQHLGVALFDTRKKRATLTAKGAEFVAHAAELLGLVDSISARMTESIETAGIVRIGASETVAMTWLSSFVKSMRKEHPKVILAVDVDIVAGLISKFRSGLVDVIIVSPAFYEHGTEVLNIGSYEYSWMASPEIDLPDRMITPNDLADFPIISLTDGSALYQLAVKWFRDHGAAPNWVNHCSSVTMVMALTEAALGISLLPASLMQDKIKSGQLRQLDVEPNFPKLNFSISYNSNTTSPALLAVVRQLHLSSTFDQKDPMT